jgi:hypothetical protein
MTLSRPMLSAAAATAVMAGASSLWACGRGNDRGQTSFLPSSDSRPQSLPWRGRTPSGNALRIVVRGKRPVDCVDVHIGRYDSSDYCVTKWRKRPLDAATELDCPTGDALLVGSVANERLTVQLQPRVGSAEDAVRFADRTSTARRRLVALSFPASLLPARLVVLGPDKSVLLSHRIPAQSKRCAGDGEKLLFGWL